MVRLIQNTRSQVGLDKNGCNAYVDAFIHEDDVGPALYDVPQLASPPLFPRGRKPGSALSTGNADGLGIKDMKELGSTVMPGQAGSDDSNNLYRDHMAVVDGWGAYMPKTLHICAKSCI